MIVFQKDHVFDFLTLVLLCQWAAKQN